MQRDGAIARRGGRIDELVVCDVGLDNGLLVDAGNDVELIVIGRKLAVCSQRGGKRRLGWANATGRRRSSKKFCGYFSGEGIISHKPGNVQKIWARSFFEWRGR